MRRIVRVVGVACWIAGLVLAGSGAVAQDAPSVLRAEVSGAITPVIASYLSDGVERAADEGHELFLVEIDTPGGLDTSMREIVQSFLNARVPVVVYVAPRGARAASAGAIIAMASHVAAMAPGTNIGASTPVDLQGGDIGDKIINDATAYAQALAELRGRDVDFARDIVREGRSEPASEAVRIGAVDLQAPTTTDLLSELDGRTVALDERNETTLATTGATITEHEMGFLRGARQRLADPNLAFLFMSLGTLAVIYEIANPGMGFGGIVGVILLLLAFFGLSVLPVNLVGVLLLLLGIGLFVAELFVPGIGVFAAGGAVSFALSGIFLFRGSIGVDLVVILPTVLVMMGAVVFAARLVWRARMRRSDTGKDMVTGRTVALREAHGQRGQVVIDGTWWRVRSAEPLEVGGEVRVTEMDGNELVVEPIEGATTEPRTDQTEGGVE